MASRAVIVGLDFGTTNCVVSITYPNGEVKTINLDGPRIRYLPSIVKFSSNSVVVGSAANDDDAVVNGNVVFKIKSVLGKKFATLTNEEKKACGAKVVADENGYAAFFIPILNEKRSAIAVASEIFKVLYQKILSDTNGYDIQSIVITYPAAFKQDQLAAIRTAANMAIKDTPLSFLKEPTAATYAAKHISNAFVRKSKYLLYDLGGGTYDYSLVELDGNTMRILKTGGLPNIGGELFDTLIEDFFVKKYYKDTGYSLLQEDNDDALQYKVLTLFRTICKKMKENICKSLDPQYKEELDLNGFFRKWSEYLGMSNDGVVEENYNYYITIRDFYQLIEHYIDNTIEEIRKCLQNCHLSVDDIAGVILLGGSSNIPLVRMKLERCFGHDRLKFNLDPNTCVSYGASLFAKYRDMQEEYVEGCKYGYYTRVLRHGSIAYKPLIKKGTPFNKVVESNTFTIRPENGGILQDVIYEGDGKNPAAFMEIARIECANVPSKVKYVFRFTEDGVLYYSLKDAETGRVFLNDSCLSKL